MSCGGAVVPATEFGLAFDKDALHLLRTADETQRLTMAGRFRGVVASALLRGLEHEARAGRMLCIDVCVPLLFD